VATPSLQQGDIIRYSYRWLDEAAADRAPEGAKDRPVCVALLVQSGGLGTKVFLLAISSKPPRGDQLAIEVPDIERRRGGLTRYARAWVAVGEYNVDLVEHSHVLEPQRPMGRFSEAFLKTLVAEVVAGIQKKTARGVPRA
jgi:hypothetical protein